MAGRMLVTQATHSQVTLHISQSFFPLGFLYLNLKFLFFVKVEDEKTILRGQIGSRPPRCERRCGSCGHCEAIQVPTNPQIKNTASNAVNNPAVGATIAYARGDYSSNYKPMSWKCKCGSFIFNP